LDIVDTHSYVESGAIDGWITSTGIWQGIGSVNQLLNNYANSDINELFYDLRPMTDVEHFNPTDYLHTPDEINGNVDHTHQSPNGIRYVPCVVMREYPYSTIPSIEGKDIRVRLQADNQSTTALVGTIPIGAIFSDQPNLPGRHEVPIKAYAVETIVSGTPKIAKKIMDVAVITTREIRSSNFSRSDADHFNLFELTSGSAQLTSMKYLTSDILPIITPIHIMRHGLRTKMVTSLFANFSFGGTVQRDSEGVATTASVASDASVEESAFSVTMTTSVVIPIEEGANNQGQVSSVYGYRPRRAGGAVTNTPQDGGNWVFHNGVDIRAAVGTPVRAIMDGLVVGSVPDGVLDSYGSTVIIKHVDTGGRVVYSQYSHLSSRTVGAHNEVTGFNRAGKAAGFSKDLAHYGTFSTEKVTAGQTIGYVGLTGDKQGTTTVESVGAHCHFEILTGAQKTIYPSGNKDFTPDVAITSDPATHVIPVGSNPRSADPIAYFAGLSGGVILNTTSAPDPSGTNTEPDGDTDSVGVPDDPAVTSDPTENANSSHSLASTDNISTRKQILRWALLQDHWYQHNLEYLSGQITMRGAPEIRVGYRLDIQDRGLSFYVEGVSHSWEFGKELITVLTVTRGQSHNPFPLYVMPPLNAWVEEPVNQRTLGSRLAQYMDVPDPTAVGNAVVLRNHHGREQFIRATDRSFNPGILNRTDFIGENIEETNAQGVVVDGGAIFTHPVYNEEVIPAETLSTLETAQFAVFGEPPATEAIIEGPDLVSTDTETILKEMDLWIAEEP
jgi:murein DD-endopeptidase MepM/ murein hydrolase activator NlpD